MYSVSSYGEMIADRIRARAYARALESAIKPGAVVLDLGTGATGIFAMLACRYGARQVYALESDDGIELARRIASANSLADRIIFIQGLSTDVTLPETADVIISDLRGILPLFGCHIPSIKDARERLLSSGGTLIPQEDTLWVGVADTPALYERYQVPWDRGAFGFDLGPGRNIVTNTWHKGRTTPDQLLSEPVCWATLNYRTIGRPHVHGEVALRVNRAGTAHGLCVWFDSILVEAVELSNAPGAPELIYGQAFFPLPEPVAVVAGDTVNVSIRADLVGEDYVWQWVTQIVGPGSPRVKANFKQSTFLGVPLSPARLRKRAANHIPSLSADGQVRCFALSLMDGRTSLDRIAEQLAARFRDRFGDSREALAVVADLSAQYGQ